MVKHMYLNEVLQLDMVSGSIKKIDLFLAGCNKRSLDYYKAFSYRNRILHAIGKTNDALKALYALVPDFSKMEDEAILAVCDAIIEITLSIRRFDQTRKYIDIKKEHLKISNAILNTIDEIQYSMAKRDFSTAITELKKYLNDEITADEQCWAYEQLAQIYFEIHEIKEYLEVARKLEKIYQDSLNTKKLISILFTRLEIAFEEGNYVRVICDANRFMNEYDLEDELTLKTATLLIWSYLKSNDFKKASIIESNYEEKLRLCSIPTALEFCKASLELYTKTNSIVSIKHYQDLVQEFSQEKRKVKTKHKPSAPILIPNIEREEMLEQPVEEVKDETSYVTAHPVCVHTLPISNQYIKLEKLFATINNLEDTTKFREIYRMALIELAKFIPFEEAYLVYYDHVYCGLHYKKERAYDKRLDYEALDDTINFLAITKEQEVYLDLEARVGLKNIVTKEPFIAIPYGIAIPLFKEDVCYASIAFWAEQSFLDQDLVYETLKLISQMLNKSLIAELRQNQLKASNKRMFFIYDNMSSGTKELMEGQIHLSQQAKELLGGLEDMENQDYLAHIHAQDISMYEAVLDELYHYLPSNKSIEYRYKKGADYIHIRETFYPCYENGIVLLYSLLEDITSRVRATKDLVQLAYTNPTTKLETEVKLLIDLKESISKRKLSLAVLDIHDFKLYEELYGVNFANQLIFAVATELKKSFEESFITKVYHLEFDRYAILFLDTNDKRTVDNLLFKCLDRISKNLNLLNSRVKLYFNCGVYRVSKSTTLIDPAKTLLFAYDALTDSKEEKSLAHHIHHYDGEAAKRRFNENQLVTHISESIDHGKLGISYKQVVDVTKGEIFAYYATLSLDNFEVDSTHMQRVIERRKLQELLDKYVISTASKELRMLRDHLKTSVYVIVELSKETLTEKLAAFVEGQNNFYKTTRNLIFLVQDAEAEEVKRLKEMGYFVAGRNPMELYHKSLDYFIYDIKENGFTILPEIKELCASKDVVLILSNVTEKEEIEKAQSLGLKYLYGGYYKKSIRMKKVIEKLA